MYKRQAEAGVVSLEELHDHIDDGALSGAHRSIEAVSYTHLDVYKRQRHSKPLLRIELVVNGFDHSLGAIGPEDDSGWLVEHHVQNLRNKSAIVKPPQEMCIRDSRISSSGVAFAARVLR